MMPSVWSARRIHLLVLAALAWTVFLRLWHIRIPFFDDEADWVMFAQRIGLSGVTVHRPYHGPLFVYALALSRLLFGSTPEGWRMVNAALGCALCLSIYALVRLTSDRRTAALALAAGNGVLVYFSGLVSHRVQR